MFGFSKVFNKESNILYSLLMLGFLKYSYSLWIIIYKSRNTRLQIGENRIVIKILKVSGTIRGLRNADNVG